MTGAMRWLYGVGIALAMSLMCCAAAHAGTYVMSNCNVPGHHTSATGPWFWEAATNVVPADECKRGGGFGFYFGGPLAMSRGASAALTIALPPNGPIAIRRVRLWMVARLEGTGSALFVGTNAGAADAQVTNNGLFSPPGGDSVASPSVTPLLPPGTNIFRILLYCSESSSDDCHPTSRSVLEVIGAEVTLLESTAPSISFAGGSILSGDIQSGARTLQFSAADGESGIRSVEVLFDDTVVAKQDFAQECPHADLAACPRTRADELTIDTSVVANGIHRLRLRTTDAAGNRGDAELQRPVHVTNATDRSASEVQNGRVTFAFSGTSRRTTTVNFGARIRVHGRLTDRNGQAVGNATVSLLESDAGRADFVARQTRQTRSDGRFTFRIASRGRSRSLRVEHQSPGGTAALLVSRALRMKVRAAARLAVSLEGVRVRYRGSVVSRPIPSRGILLAMQGRRKGGAWQPFAYHRVRRNGTFRGSYRLRVRRPGVRLQFRAVIPSAGRYPYEPGRSASVTRTVR